MTQNYVVAASILLSVVLNVLLANFGIAGAIQCSVVQQSQQVAAAAAALW